MRCHTEKRAFIPGCIGGAVYGKQGCTCPSRSEMEKDSSDKIRAMEARLLSLEVFVHKNLRRAPENEAVCISQTSRGSDAVAVDPETAPVSSRHTPVEAKANHPNKEGEPK